ncbi:MAG: type IV toxin-antitoxin system AbiEi family antitoxin domain-containing protein [Actinomycetota bacterium]|nr:type IV toxin-antitoxin system AbiEi family antitoxin domain-containing protein [Actinomycetota bacterium]
MGATHRATTTAGLVDQLIVGIAARSHGVTTRAELLAVGVSHRSIEHRVANGVLEVAHRGVYVTSALRTERTGLAAATKAVTGSAVARATAGVLHGFSWERWLARQGWHIVGPNGAALRDRRVTTHQTRYLPDHHRVRVDDLVVTTPERTICDLAASISPARLNEFVEHQLVERRVDLDGLLACHLEMARRGRAGTQALRDVLNGFADPRDFPQSVLELAVQERLVR